MLDAEGLLNAAAAMAKASTEFTDVLVQHSLPTDFVAQLDGAAKAYRGAIDAGGEARGGRRGATKGLQESLGRARSIVAALSVLIHRGLRTDSAALAEWDQITRVTIKGVQPDVAASPTPAATAPATVAPAEQKAGQRALPAGHVPLHAGQRARHVRQRASPARQGASRNNLPLADGRWQKLPCGLRPDVARCQLLSTSTPMRTAPLVLLWSMCVALSLPCASASQQPSPAADSSARPAITHLLRTRDGTTHVGRLVAESADTVRFATSGGMLVVPRAQVAELRTIDPSSVHEGQYWPPDPHATRLYFGPTGRTLKRGEGYFSDLWLFFVNGSVGVTDRLMLGGGMSVFPTSDFSNNIFYLTPKVGIVRGEHFNVAVGALVGFAGKASGSAGMVYGVATNGGPDGSLSYGAGWAYANKDFASRPVLMLGGSRRWTRRVAFISENYMYSGAEPGALVSYGLRFFGEKLSVDLAFWNVLANGATPFFPGVPWLGFAVKF